MTKEEFELMMLGLEDVGFPGGAAKLREHEEELRKVIARNVGALRNTEEAQAQLAEAVGIMKRWREMFDGGLKNGALSELWADNAGFLARHVQAEQQAAKSPKTSALAHFDEEVAGLRTFVESGEYALSGVNVVYNHSQHVNDKRPVHPYRVEATLYLRRAAPNEYA